MQSHPVTMLLNSLIQDLRVTSVLNDNDKSYGSKFLLDGKEDTCWNSEFGLPQSIFFSFSEACEIELISLMFQGGFVGTVCDIYSQQVLLHTIFPKDVNELQEFIFPSAFKSSPSSLFELRFTMSSDFYGRVTVYMLQIYGNKYS